MSEYDEKLSAFLDGELSDAEAAEIETALARDPALQAELEALMAADVLAKDAFGDMVSEPLPQALAAAIRDADVAGPANTTAAPSWFSGWIAATAACVMLLIGGAGGYLAGSSRGIEVAAAPSWLADIADYHAVYAGQTRHLVEVRADEADHIMTWLTNTVGADVRIPDLAASGLTFEGARLLVAAGKPVAQLMYTDADGGVVALCLIANPDPQSDVRERTIGAFDMVSWGGDGANFVIVGETGRDDLDEIAAAAALQV